MSAKRDIIKIDEELCNGCGLCVKGCHEGALQLIDGKARIVSELYCDGLGACIGDCPVGAIQIETREAEPYDEIAVMERIAPRGKETIKAHLLHLKEHGETLYLQQGLDYLKEKNITISLAELEPDSKSSGCGCLGSKELSFNPIGIATATSSPASQLRQWPVQLHLLNPQASYFHKSDVVLAADCVAFAYADFHNRFIHNHTIAIACPKLDSNKEVYVSKLTAMIDKSEINTLTVIIMEVPCCNGLLQLALKALEWADRKIPIKCVIVGIKGEILEENWI